MNDLVLLIDDDPNLLMLVEHELEQEGIQTMRAVSAQEGLKLLSDHDPAAVVLDLGLPDRAGDDVLAEMAKRAPGTAVVVLTARGAVDAVVECMRLGAVDFVQKPFERARLVTSVRNALEQSRLRRQVASLTRELREGEGFGAILGESEALEKSLALLGRAATSDVTVLVAGESGTGKELAARAIHAESARSGGPLVAVNCGAIPEGLVESQLFGHEKGAFTGATNVHPGFFEQADGGTIFLDEVGELRPELQVKLLRVLQERVVQRVGATRTRPVDVRVVAASNKDLGEQVTAGEFRSDLYYRLAVFPITLPPLRERREDVLLLSQMFVQRFAERHARAITSLTQDAKTALMAYPWPGNIRQLENALERAVIIEDGPDISLGSLPEDVVCAMDGGVTSAEDASPREDKPAVAPGDEQGGMQTLAEQERGLIDRALTQAEGNVTSAASILGIGRATLYRKIERYGFQDRLQRGRRAASD